MFKPIATCQDKHLQLCGNTNSQYHCIMVSPLTYRHRKCRPQLCVRVQTVPTRCLLALVDSTRKRYPRFHPLPLAVQHLRPLQHRPLNRAVELWEDMAMPTPMVLGEKVPPKEESKWWTVQTLRSGHHSLQNLKKDSGLDSATIVMPTQQATNGIANTESFGDHTLSNR